MTIIYSVKLMMVKYIHNIEKDCVQRQALKLRWNWLKGSLDF